MVVWIVGMSGSGKTYFAKKLCEHLKKNKKKIIWIDGDDFRKKYSKDLGYSVNDRRMNSKRIQKFCLKHEKKYIVICSILSIFPEHQKLNTKIFNKYLQIYIKANKLKLKIRNNKKIYTKKTNVVGKDIKFPSPYNSNLVLKNNFDSKFLKNINKVKNLILNEL